jgi:putative nucleotidyltransferase with HDIG domain
MKKPFEPIENELMGRRWGWWERILKTIPELAALEDTKQPPEYHAEGDVARHTRLTVEACPPECSPDLLWAALLHDIGKPAVTRDGETRVTARGHHTLGAEMTEVILSRLGMPQERRELIAWAVKNHLFHLSWNLTSPDQVSPRQKRFIADPRFPLLLELLKVDSIASKGNPRGMEAYNLYKTLFERIFDGQHDEH